MRVKLPILMYHEITAQDSESNGLTISISQLEKHLQYLKDEGFTPLHFGDLPKNTSTNKLPKKPIIITFDDVYENQLKGAYPLLQRYGFKACFYIPFGFVGKFDDWDGGKQRLMSLAQLKSLDPKIIELGFHSYHHRRYDELTLTEVEADLDQCLAFEKQTGLKIHHTLAYPYGRYPQKRNRREAFMRILEKKKIVYGLRIGNRVNRFPFKNNFEIQRLDIKGEDDLKTFRQKINRGKSWF